MCNPLQASDNHARGYSVVKAHSRREGEVEASNNKVHSRRERRIDILCAQLVLLEGGWAEELGEEEGMAEELGEWG